MSLTITAPALVVGIDALPVAQDFHLYCKNIPIIPPGCTGAALTGQIFGRILPESARNVPRLRFSLRRPENVDNNNPDHNGLYNIVMEYNSATTFLMLDEDVYGESFLYTVDKSELTPNGSIPAARAVFRITTNNATGTSRIYSPVLQKYLAVQTTDWSVERKIRGRLDSVIELNGYTRDFLISSQLSGTSGAVIAGDADTERTQTTPLHQFYIQQALSPNKYLRCTNDATAALTQFTPTQTLPLGPNDRFAFYRPDPTKFTYRIRTSQPDSNGKYQFLCMNESDHPTIPDEKVYTIELRDEDNLFEWEEWELFPMTETNLLGTFKLQCTNFFTGDVQQQIVPQAPPSVAVVGGATTVVNSRAIMFIARVPNSDVWDQTVRQVVVEKFVEDKETEIKELVAREKAEIEKLVSDVKAPATATEEPKTKEARKGKSSPQEEDDHPAKL